jgi:hypothetical protein
MLKVCAAHGTREGRRGLSGDSLRFSGSYDGSKLPSTGSTLVVFAVVLRTLWIHYVTLKRTDPAAIVTPTPANRKPRLFWHIQYFTIPSSSPPFLSHTHLIPRCPDPTFSINLIVSPIFPSQTVVEDAFFPCGKLAFLFVHLQSSCSLVVDLLLLLDCLDCSLHLLVIQPSLTDTLRAHPGTFACAW